MYTKPQRLRQGNIMSFSLTDDFRTDSELADHTQEILDQVRQTGRPIVITVEGKPAAVVVDAAAFETKLKAVNLAELIAEAEASVRAGKTRPVEEFFRELDRETKIPRGHRSRSRKRPAKLS